MNARGVIRQDQYGRLALTHEIARHGPDEVGIGPVHLRQEPVDHVHRDVGPALDQLRTPALHVVLVAEIRHLRPEPAWLHRHGRHDTIRGPLQEVPDEGTGYAEAQHHELVDAQMIHQAEMVVGIGIPRPVDLERAGGLAGVGVAQIRRDAAVLTLELLNRVEGIAAGKPAIVEPFKPPPAMSNSGKPEPASS